MKKGGYKYLYSKIKEKKLERICFVLDKSISAMFFISYPIILALLYIDKCELAIKMTAVPACAFIAVTLLRIVINARRPYEVININPPEGFAKHGRSFPSRHSFSCFMISFCCLNISTALGTVLLVFSVLLSALRVFCRAHFIKDVAAGFLLALASYIIGFTLI